MSRYIINTFFAHFYTKNITQIKLRIQADFYSSKQSQYIDFIVPDILTPF